MAARTAKRLESVRMFSSATFIRVRIGHITYGYFHHFFLPRIGVLPYIRMTPFYHDFDLTRENVF